MRDIIFRGKRKDNGEWVEGSLILTTSTMEKPFIVDSCWCYSGSVDDEGYAKFEYLNAYEVIRESVSEYTGLTDKNGEKIFEGDILNCLTSDFDGSDKYVYNYKITDITDFEKMGFLDFCNELEVIGNIHDNPELLEEG